MEISQLITELQEKYSEHLIEIGSFGNIQELVCLSVKAESAPLIMRVLRDQFEFTDFISLLVAETPSREKKLRLSAFIRHQLSGSELVIRVDHSITGTDQVFVIPSLSKIWNAATSFEKELGDLFGVFFEGNNYFEKSKKRYLLPDNWEGFPLRKDYVFPMEFLDIPHSRPVGQSEPDEHGFGG